MPLIFWGLTGLGAGFGLYKLSDEASKVIKYVVIGGVVYYVYKKSKG